MRSRKGAEMSRILITGGSGYLGQTLANLFSSCHDVYPGHHQSSAEALPGSPLRFDICEPEQLLKAFQTSRPEFVVHTAALTKPDDCEARPDEARRLNVIATGAIARACEESGAKLVHISTDLVFDGVRGGYDEQDEVFGISEYARSKINAERAVVELNPTAVILRVSVMYGPPNPTHPGFLDEMVRRWRQGQPSTFFVDQFRTPTFIPQIAQAVTRIMALPATSGILHLGAADRVSRYDFARIVAQAIGAGDELLKPGLASDHPTRAKRGADCSLVCRKIGQVLGIEPLSCSEGIKKLIENGSLRRL